MSIINQCMCFFAYAAIRLDDHRCEVCCYSSVLYHAGLLLQLQKTTRQVAWVISLQKLLNNVFENIRIMYFLMRFMDELKLADLCVLKSISVRIITFFFMEPIFWIHFLFEASLMISSLTFSASSLYWASATSWRFMTMILALSASSSIWKKCRRIRLIECSHIMFQNVVCLGQKYRLTEK